MKSDVFMDSDRMRFHLQMRAENIIIMVIIIIIINSNIVVVVVVGQFANKKCAPGV